MTAAGVFIRPLSLPMFHPFLGVTSRLLDTYAALKYG
jgi:hypothetical protein